MVATGWRPFASEDDAEYGGGFGGGDKFLSLEMSDKPRANIGAICVDFENPGSDM
jgi:hypothetical protein